MVAGDVILQADLPASQALFLDAQHHDYIGAVYGFFGGAADVQSRSQRGGQVGEELRRPAESDLASELAEQVNR